MRDTWIFGYGSLVWRPAFEFVERVPGDVDGWARRFWQGSTDHRGVVGAPGRVVTLVRAPAETTWGMLYRVGREQSATVLDGLDWREKGGYERAELTVQVPAESRRVGGVLTYLATEDNPEFLGDAPLGEIVAQIANSRGPSGPNHEYATRLAEALREMGVEDDHVEEIDRGLRER